MDLKIPNIVKAIELKDYASEFGEAKIYVWVNPTKELRIFLAESILEKKATNEQIAEWLAEIWSQGPDESTHFTKEQVITLGAECMERAPKMMSWLIQRTYDLLEAHYISKKKLSITQP